MAAKRRNFAVDCHSCILIATMRTHLLAPFRTGPGSPVSRRFATFPLTFVRAGAGSAVVSGVLVVRGNRYRQPTCVDTSESLPGINDRTGRDVLL